MKTTVLETKTKQNKTPNGINRRLEIAGAKTSEYQDIATGTIQNEKHREKKTKKKKRKERMRKKGRGKKKGRKERKEH